MMYVITIIILDLALLPTVPRVVYRVLERLPPDYSYVSNYISVMEPQNLIMFLILQLPVLALCVAVGWNTNKLHSTPEINKEFGTPEAAGSGQHGTSRWQTEDERDRAVNVWLTNKPLSRGGIVFGIEQLKVWLDDEDVHTLMIGATRSGKTRRLILPSMWELAKAGESMVLGDPKGELFITTNEYLKDLGYEVISLNLRDPLKGNRWNILDMVNQYVDEGNIPKAVEAAWDIAHAIVNQRPYHGEPIWQNGEESVIASLIMLVCLESEFKFQRHITSVYYLLAEYGSAVTRGNATIIPLNEYIMSLDTLHPAKGAYAAATMAHHEARASFFMSALADLRIFSDPLVADMTAKSDHSLKATAVRKTAVFLIVPDDKSTRNVLATLYIDQLYSALVESAADRGGRLQIRTNYILDEFGNLPIIPNFSKKLTVAGGRGIRFSIAVQDIGQIKDLYEKTYTTITGNCHNWIYLLTADQDTAELISKKTGNYTVETEGASSSVGDKNSSFGANVNMTGRALLMPEEIIRWPQDKSLVLRVRQFPSWYPMPDLAKWKANEDFGLTGDRERDREIIEARENGVLKRQLSSIEIWKLDFTSIGESEDDEPDYQMTSILDEMSLD